MTPIVVELDLACPLAHAFEMWTSRPATWWPRAHTISQDPDLEIVFEPFVGGRVFERASDGSEHEWGEVTLWDPPHRVDYLWHLFFARDEATKVSVVFEETTTGSSVRLEQVGFEILPEPTGTDRRNETNKAWLEVIGYYERAI